MNASAPSEHLTFADADARLDGSLSVCFQGDYDTVLFFDGDVVLGEDFLQALGELGGREVDIVVITGDLTVSGPIALYDSTPGLYVEGTTRAETLEGGDAEIYIQDGVFTHLVYGYYNHGILEAGRVQTPWVINSDHDLRITAPDARHVDNCSAFSDAEFNRDNIVEWFVPEVVDREHGSIVVEKFLSRLRAGLPVRSWL
ncbi:hypothetical protein [Planomonospora venezuelensis]|uniref:Uncharacterized protein n=1 Tax=Planomonospora venezuelensis TaxID=1999 RepID=A0A841DDA0_PLAVE|nr:hypothetical protein [Planomonospora venezuelensis]MBB5968050.1 hypothetical protein [Planomonospora venezuelensis]GIN04667.1 hypothetical protein Pve01_63250 [Planomonospora venezuelensis]